MKEDLELKKRIKEDWRVFSSFINHNINIAKKILGSQCTFLSFMNAKEQNKETGDWKFVKSFYAVMKNDLGGKDKIVLKLEKEIWDIDAQDFKDLIFTLNSRTYESGRSV